MRLAYLTMQTPAPSEVFLVVEMRHLAKFADMHIFCLRKPHPQHQELVQQENLFEIPIHYFAYFFSLVLWKDTVYWFRKKPFLLWHMLWLITRLCWRKPKVWLLSLAILPKSFSIARMVEKSAIEIVHAAWGHYPAVTLYLIKKLLPDVHITLALGAYDRLANHPMTAVVITLTDGVFTQNPASAEFIQKAFPAAPVVAIMRGVDTQMADHLKTPEKISGLIVSAGRLVIEKGHQVVIEAFAQIHAKLPHTRLLILGEGPYRTMLEAQIDRLNLRDAVTFAGHLPHVAAFQQMAVAEVFALATEADYENMPNVIKEAMALGLAVVTTPTLGIENLVEDGVTGLLIPMGDVEALREAIQKILEDSALRDFLEKNAAARIHERFSVEQTTRQRLAVFQQILET